MSVCKSIPPSTTVTTPIKRVRPGHDFVINTIPVKLFQAEYEILHLIGGGFSNEEIAQKRYVSIRSLKPQISKIFKKFELICSKDREALMLIGEKFKLFPNDGAIFQEPSKPKLQLLESLSELERVVAQQIVDPFNWNSPPKGPEESLKLPFVYPSNQDIATNLDISFSSARSTCGRVLVKLGVTDRPQAINSYHRTWPQYFDGKGLESQRSQK